MVEKTEKEKRPEEAAGPEFGCLQFHKGEPFYELTGDRLRFLFTIERNGARRSFAFAVEPYSTPAVIAMLRGRNTYVQPSRDDPEEAEIVRAPHSAIHDFVRKHVIDVQYLRTSGAAQKLTVRQIETLCAEYGLETSVIDLGYNLINDDSPELDPAEDQDDPSLEEIFAEDRRIHQSFQMADAAGSEHRIRISHAIRQVTASDSIKWDACRVEKRGRKGRQTVAFRYEEIGKLYDSLVTEVSGFRFEGIECKEGNQAVWLHLVPYFFKLFCCFQLFKEGRRKNA